MTVTAKPIPQQEATFHNALLKRYESRQPVMCEWVRQIQRAIRSVPISQELWGAVGHGLVVIDPDTDELARFLMAAADALGGQYLPLTVKQFLDCTEPLSRETLPSIVFIEPGPWLRGREESHENIAPRAGVIEALRTFYEESSPVVLVSYTSRYGEIPEIFRYREALDRHIFWATPEPSLIAEDLYDQAGTHYLDASLLHSPDRVGRLMSLEFPSVRRVGMLSAAMRRRAMLQDRRVGWRDLVEITVNGTGEGFRANPHINLKQTATHEAGHAVVNMAGSGFKGIPEMVTVAQGNGTSGLMVESFHHAYEKRGGDITFAEICQRIRTCMAGRAAEEMEYGIRGCSAYASEDDLENASRMALEMIATNGFPANYNTDQAAGTNLLAATVMSELGDPVHYDRQVRQLLAKLYQETKAIIQENNALFKVVRDQLLQDRCLMKEDLERIVAQTKSREKTA